jgi:hypothetical protein
VNKSATRFNEPDGSRRANRSADPERLLLRKASVKNVKLLALAETALQRRPSGASDETPTDAPVGIKKIRG